MLSQRVYHLPNLDGGIDYVTDDGRQITKQELDATNLGKDFRYVSVTKDAEQIEKHFANLLGDRVETDQQLQAIPADAKARTNKFLGIVDPAIQQATPSNASRMAASPSFTEELNAIMKPWAQRTRDANNKDLWIGLDAPRFNEAAKDLEYEIRAGGDDYNYKQSMMKKLQREYGYGPKQAASEVNALIRNPNSRLAAIAKGTPNARADEAFSELAMRGSGLSVVPTADGDPIWATDFMLQRPGQGSLGIDAQRQYANQWKIALLQKMSEGEASAIEREFGIRSNDKIGDIIRDIKTSDMTEGKLLHMLDPRINANPSNHLQADFDNIRKDYILSGDMRGWQQPANERGIFKGQRHGSYNPAAPNNLNLIDLAPVREAVFDRTPAQLRDDLKGSIRLVGEGNDAGISLNMPRPQLINLDRSDPLDRKLVDEIARRKTWGRR